MSDMASHTIADVGDSAVARPETAHLPQEKLHRPAWSRDDEHAAQKHTHAAAPRRGFTLFEIGISLVIVAFGVVSVLLLIPSGVKVQQRARMSMLATAKALELVHLFSNKIGGERIAEFETPEPWEARPFCYASTRWDMEHRASRWDGGIIPLPLDIAKRLDADGDEIQHLLASGAYIYYADPKVLPGVDPRFINSEAPNEATKLIFAISGYAQNNAIPIFPWKAWPYRAAYPSPPLTVGLEANRQLAPKPPTAWASLFPGSNWNSLEGWTNGDPDPSRPQDRDPLMNDVFQAFASYYLGLKDTDVSDTERLDFVAGTTSPSLIDLRSRLVDAVVAFCKDKFNGPLGNPAEYALYYNPPLSTGSYQVLAKAFTTDFRALCRAAEPLPGMSYDAGKAQERAKIALRVQCMRFLAFAASTFHLTRVTNADTGASERAPDLTKAFIDGTQLSLDRLRYYQDCCKEAAMLYAASFPYDWGAPRPITRCIMTDHPLIEFDLFNSRTMPIGGGDGANGTMWKPIAAQSITSIGLPGIFPGVLAYSGTGDVSWDGTRSPFRSDAYPRDARGPGHPFWGDAAHFTLTRPFQAAERCRQLIFWSVDWQSYEDAETAPGAPMDASRLGRHGPSSGELTFDRFFYPGGSYDALHLRNPERVLQFNQEMVSYQTGQSLAGSSPSTVGLRDGDDNLNVLTGQYGADRNHNYLLDRGPLPKSVRQKAQTVARFQFYDPRIPVLLR